MKISIGRKLAIAFFTFVLLLSIMGAITFNGFLKTVEEFDSIEKEVMKQITAGNLRFTVTQVVMASNDYIISADTSFKENFEKQNILLDKYYHEFTVFDLTENEYKLLTTIKSDIDSIRYYSEMIFAIDNPRISPAVVEYMKIIDHKFGHDINEKTTRIFDGIAQRIQACKTKGEQLKEKQAELIFNLIIAGIIFSIVFMLLIIYKITKPIKSLKSAAETIASGDYTVRPKVKTKDEIASLADSFSLMAESISKAHKKISDSNLLLETIFSTIPSGLMVVGEDGKITTINKRMREIINIGETTLEQRTIQNVLEKVNLSDDCREFILHTKLVKNYECVSIDLQGSQKYFGLTLLPVGLTEKQNLLVADDITGYKQQQKKLEELQQFNQTTLDSLPAYICVLDETGCIININKAWKENAIPGSILLSQVSPGLNYLDSIKNNSGKTNEDALKLKRGIEEVMVGLKDKFDLEYFCPVSEENNWFVVRIRPFDGSNAFPCKVVVSHTNITDRKKAELSLKESEERYRSLFEASPVGILIEDEEGNILDANESITRIAGYSKEELIGKNVKIFVPKERYELVDKHIKQILSGKTIHYETDSIKKDGSIIYNRLYETCVNLPNGNKEIISISNDITESRKIEMQNKEMAERYAALLETTLDGFWIIDNKGKMIDVNENYCKMSGYKRDELLEMSITDLEALETPEETYQHINEVIENGADRFETKHRRKDGSIWDVEINTVYWKNMEQFIVFTLDITERKLAEEALRKSEMLLSKAQAIAHLGNWDWNILTNEQLWSTEVYRILGVEREHFQVVPGAHENLIHPNDREWVLKSEREALYERKPYNIEFRIVHPDGDVRFVHEQAEVIYDPAGTPARMFGTIQDITERKGTEVEIAKREKRYRALFNLSPSGIVLEDVEGNIVEVNEAFCKSIGYSPEELVGSNVRMVASSEEIPNIEDHIALLRSGKTLQHVVENIKKDGTRSWVELYETMILLPDEREGFLVVTNDITERKRAEEEIYLLLTLTQTIAEAKDFNSSLDSALRMVSENTSWDLGEIWVPSIDSKYLELSPSWYSIIPNVESFRTASKRFIFEPGAGLPGRVWSSKKPVWIPDVTVDANFPRATFAKEVGFKAAVGIPIVADNDVVAVMVFFLREVQQEDERMVAFVSTVALELGSLFKRKQAEASLRESEEKYRTVADFTYNWEYWQSSEGKFNYVSPSCKRITGYDSNDFIKNPELLIDITHMEEKDTLRCYSRSIGKPSPDIHDIEYRIKTKNGNVKWISHTCQAVYDADGKYIGRRGSNRDITAQKANEEKILKLTKVVENSPVAIMITDKDTKIEYVNAHFMKQFSFKNNSELIGKTPSILQSGNTSNSVYSDMWKKLNTGNSWKGIIQDKCNEGKLMWLSTSITPIKDKKGGIISYATIYLDITEQLELLEKLENYKEHLEEMVEDRTRELKESRETFRALAENSKDVIIRFNNKFQYLYINPAIENFIGMKPEELIGKVHSELPLPKQLIELFDNSLKFVFEVKQNHRVEFQLPNGVWVDWLLFPEFNSIGNVTTVISSSRDITELKKLQLEIQSALEVEKELNKFKDRFISMVSHEFRTPLTSILSSTEILEMGGVTLEQKKREKHFNRIKTNIDDLIKMLEEVVYINKFNLGKIPIQKESINLKSLCKGIVDEYKELYPGIKTEINFKPEETYYKLDSSIMKKILSNLISNAFKYNNTADAIVKLDIKTKRNNLIFQITDNGIGIPIEDQKNIFEAFFRSTTTQNIQGTGLGLNIVKKLVTQLNGRISLKSEPNNGTQFTIIIPLT